MKTTYQLLVIKAKIKYPNDMDKMQEHIWKAYIDGLIKNEKELTKSYQTNDYDKGYMVFKSTKIVDNLVTIDGKKFVETQAFYFVLCKYINNKLASYDIQNVKYPKQSNYRGICAYG